MTAPMISPFFNNRVARTASTRKILGGVAITAMLALIAACDNSSSSSGARSSVLSITLVGDDNTPRTLNFNLDVKVGDDIAVEFTDGLRGAAKKAEIGNPVDAGKLTAKKLKTHPADDLSGCTGKIDATVTYTRASGDNHIVLEDAVQFTLADAAADCQIVTPVARLPRAAESRTFDIPSDSDAAACPALSHIANGRVTIIPETRAIDSKATYHCNEGYGINGVTIFKCRSADLMAIFGRRRAVDWFPPPSPYCVSLAPRTPPPPASKDCVITDDQILLSEGDSCRVTQRQIDHYELHGIVLDPGDTVLCTQNRIRTTRGGKSDSPFTLFGLTIACAMHAP